MGSFVAMLIIGFITWLWARSHETWSKGGIAAITIVGGLLWPLTIILGVILVIWSVIKSMFGDLFKPTVVDFNNPPDFSALQLENIVTEKGRPLSTSMSTSAGQGFVCIYCGKTHENASVLTSGYGGGCYNSPTKKCVATQAKPHYVCRYCGKTGDNASVLTSGYGGGCYNSPTKKCVVA